MRGEKALPAQRQHPASGRHTLSIQIERDADS